MKYLNMFMDEPKVNIEVLALELHTLSDESYKELLSTLAMMSGLEKLEAMNEVADYSIKTYSNLKKWRDRAGERT